MKVTLDRETLNIAHAAASKNTRPVLQCVKIGHGEVVASDGFMLIRKSEPEMVKEKDEHGEVLIYATDILEAKKAGGKQLTSLTIDTDQGKEALLLGNGDDAESKTCHTSKPLKATYPTYESIYPDSEAKAHIAITSSILVKLLKVVGAAHVIKFRVRRTDQPLEFVTSNGFSGLIMPVLAKESDKSWHKVKKE